jgi:hypothetical protein
MPSDATIFGRNSSKYAATSARVRGRLSTSMVWNAAATAHSRQYSS